MTLLAYASIRSYDCADTLSVLFVSSQQQRLLLSRSLPHGPGYHVDVGVVRQASKVEPSRHVSDVQFASEHPRELAQS